MEKENKNKVDIAGYSKSRVEIFLNGIAFLVLQVAYEVFYIINELPLHWVEKDLVHIDRPIVLPSILLIISFLLINFSIFGGEGREEELQKKYGTFGIMMRKYSCLFILVFLSLMLPIYIIKLFFNF